MSAPTQSPLRALAERLRTATGGDREIDGAIALAIGGYSAWQSKYGYWNLSGPNSLQATVDDRDPDQTFDPYTGKKLPAPTLPSDWVWQIDVPEWSASIDAALVLVRDKLPNWHWHLASNGPHARLTSPDFITDKGSLGLTEPLAILSALLAVLIEQEGGG